MDHVIEFIKTHKSENKPTIAKMPKHFRGHSGVYTLPRLAHPKQMVLEQAAMASRSAAPPTPPPPVITPVLGGLSCLAYS